MGNRRNCKRKYDRTRDPEERREQGREYRKEKLREERSNIERKNEPQLEVKAGM